MKVLKVLGAVGIVILALAFVLPLFMAENSVVTSSIKINSKPATVFRQVNNLQNWINWSPFEDDTTTVNTYSGPETGVGASRQWSGNIAGDGNMTILESEAYSHIKNKLEFGPDGGAVGSWAFNESEEGVDVTWTITISNLSYPFERLMSPVIQWMMKDMLTKGLVSLKEYSEKQSDPPEIEIIETNLINALSIYDSTKIDGIGELLKKNYSRLMKYVSRKGYSISGAPMAVYHNWDPDGFIKISTVIPLHGNFRGKKEIKKFSIESGKAIFLKHFGSYDTGDSHWSIDDYINDFNLETKDFIWESYVTDPAMEPDTNKWQTDIYYPLK